MFGFHHFGYKIKSVVWTSGSNNESLTVIQIARGRSATDTIRLLLPLFEKHGLRRFHIVTGYKSFDCFTHPNLWHEF